MNIAVVGLGLIGGSFCKALKVNSFHHIMGIEADEETARKALAENAVDEIITPERLGEANLTIISLYPSAIVEFVGKYAGYFRKGTIVTDTCGIKEYVVESCTPVLEQYGVYFVGAHPMAGREFSGYDYSLPELFKGASYIITPTEQTPQMAIDLLSTLAGSIGFGRVVIATPQKHDKVIAYTSQLAHVVSNAYVKSPEITEFDGFSAGSFLDLTRVAKLNENMWTDLFLYNKKALLAEICCIEEHIAEYREAIENGDAERLKSLLKDGRILKENSLIQYAHKEKNNDAKK